LRWPDLSLFLALGRVAAIETAHIAAVLEPIWRTTPEAANRVRGRFERILG
jgi:hypothetical protein